MHWMVWNGYSNHKLTLSVPSYSHVTDNIQLNQLDCCVLQITRWIHECMKIMLLKVVNTAGVITAYAVLQHYGCFWHCVLHMWNTMHGQRLPNEDCEIACFWETLCATVLSVASKIHRWREETGCFVVNFLNLIQYQLSEGCLSHLHDKHQPTH